MKASELMGRLADILQKYGDLNVYTFPASKLAEPTIKVETLEWVIDAQQAGTADRLVVTLM